MQSQRNRYHQRTIYGIHGPSGQKRSVLSRLTHTSHFRVGGVVLFTKPTVGEAAHSGGLSLITRFCFPFLQLVGASSKKKHFEVPAEPSAPIDELFQQTMAAGECVNTGGDHSGSATRKEVVSALGTGMSRAAEAREAVALKRAKTDREEREKTALKERREAIEAARRAFVFGTTVVCCVCLVMLPGSFHVDRWLI